MAEKLIPKENTNDLSDETKVLEILKDVSYLYEEYRQIANANSSLEGLGETIPSTSFLPYELV